MSSSSSSLALVASVCAPSVSPLSRACWACFRKVSYLRGVTFSSGERERLIPFSPCWLRRSDPPFRAWSFLPSRCHRWSTDRWANAVPGMSRALFAGAGLRRARDPDDGCQAEKNAGALVAFCAVSAGLVAWASPCAAPSWVAAAGAGARSARRAAAKAKPAECPVFSCCCESRAGSASLSQSATAEPGPAVAATKFLCETPSAAKRRAGSTDEHTRSCPHPLGSLATIDPAELLPSGIRYPRALTLLKTVQRKAQNKSSSMSRVRFYFNRTIVQLHDAVCHC